MKMSGFRFQVSGLFLSAVCLAAGCAHNGGGNAPGDPDPARIRAELVRQFTWLRQVGCANVDPAMARQVAITVRHCPATGQTSDGKYTCAADSCTKLTTGCVHAWMSAWPHALVGTWMLTGNPGEQGDWCIRHETGHFSESYWCDNPAELSPNNGHPDAVHIGGKLIRSKDLIGGARWPALVRGAQFWRRTEGSEFGDAVLDGAGNVLHVKPVPFERGGGI